jgi:two-component system response regulator YesN
MALFVGSIASNSLKRKMGVHTIKILVVDDEYLVREGIEETINWAGYGFRITPSASDGEQGLDLAIKYQPDIILTDIRMPFMDGLEFMKQLRYNEIESEIVVLSGYAEFQYVKTAMEYGAASYLLKPIDNNKLLETMLELKKKIEKRRKFEKYYDRLEEEIPVLRIELLRNLLHKELTDWEEIKKRLQFYSLPITEFNNIIVLIRLDNRIEFDIDIPASNLKLISKTIQKQIEDLLNGDKDIKGISFNDTMNQWVIIIHLIKPIDKIISVLSEWANNLFSLINEDSTDYLSIGISRPCDNIQDLNRCYNETINVINNIFLPGMNNFVYVPERLSHEYRREILLAIEYIRLNYHNEITIGDVAKAIFISPDYLMHLFKTEVGKTFNECLTQFRVKKAKEYLSNPQYKVLEVASRVGYRDARYFAQVFKKHVGILPSEYRRYLSEKGGDNFLCLEELK